MNDPFPGPEPSGPTIDDIAKALAAPFERTEVKFKAQTVSGNRALAVPFVDARVIMDRLDDVLGWHGWQDSYQVLPDGAVVCRLKVRLGEEWITKEDVGGQSEQPAEGDRVKAGFSDALKRVAVKFGIGRYLYRCKPQWVDYDPQKRQFLRPPSLPETAQAQQAAPPSGKAAKRPAGGNGKAAPAGDVRERALAYEGRIIATGLPCEPGALMSHLDATFGAVWPAAEAVLVAAKDFEKQCRLAAPATDEQVAEIDGLLKACGEKWEKLAVKCAFPPGAALNELTAGQYETAKERLGPAAKEQAEKQARTARSA